MSEYRKVLGQVSPSASVDTDVYEVPKDSQAVVSTVTVCNTNALTAVVRIAVRKGGEATATKHYVYYGVSVPTTQTFATTIGMTLGAGDIVTVFSDKADVAFTVFGVEVR